MPENQPGLIRARLFVILSWFSDRYVFIAYFPLWSYPRTCRSSAPCRFQFRFFPFVSIVYFFCCPRCQVTPACRLPHRFLAPTLTYFPTLDCSPRDTRRSARSNVSAARNHAPLQFLLRKCRTCLLESERDYSGPFWPASIAGDQPLGFSSVRFLFRGLSPPKLPQRARLTLQPDAVS